MIKKLSKMLVLTLMCTMIFMGTAHAADISFNFTLGNTGTNYNRKTTDTNKKVYISDPWTIKVKSITSTGPYGVSCCPYNNSTGKVCTKSSTWINTNKTMTVNYASGDAALVYYKMCARQDNDYYTTFKIAGSFNADDTSKK